MNSIPDEDDPGSFILPISMAAPPSVAGTSTGGDVAATALHMVASGGALKTHKVRRKSSGGCSSTSGCKPKYPKKPPLMPDQPDAPKVARPCTECGKKFWSWKALFGHMRCHPERQWRGINPPPNFRRSPSPAAAWPPPSAVDGGDDYFFSRMTEEEHEVAASLLLLATSPHLDSDSWKRESPPPSEHHPPAATDDGGCSKIINLNLQSSSHKCSICARVFSSGRALGGHKRCHCNRDNFRGTRDYLHHPPSMAAANYLDLNLLPPPTASLLRDHSYSLPSSDDTLPALDLRLGL